ncbi:MAG: BrnA antitoxin family protein [Kiritimatiellia bacterium]|nr:BrnA antitoxin family protein [Kiritimatiellia bacterium]MDD4174650.1 BrnA antitoxin family protein [Kiritimatiellia bacterium]MDD4443320.1 BrnA antitoxin family protein [Kiritimatiellia bacterium]MDX9792627.1 BrnA antitoxin family protein [Kiritimatiellia bacterium]NLC82387.1 BrnA antitoxin family protein [Lentisphaerota bacterium]
MNKESTPKKSGTDWKRLQRMKDTEIDFTDIPQIDKAMFKKMVIRMPVKKAALSLRLDPRVIEWFKGQGPGYQTRINAVLQSYVEAHTH